MRTPPVPENDGFFPLHAASICAKHLRELAPNNKCLGAIAMRPKGRCAATCKPSYLSAPRGTTWKCQAAKQACAPLLIQKCSSETRAFFPENRAFSHVSCACISSRAMVPHQPSYGMPFDLVRYTQYNKDRSLSSVLLLSVLLLSIRKYFPGYQDSAPLPRVGCHGPARRAMVVLAAVVVVVAAAVAGNCRSGGWSADRGYRIGSVPTG